MKILMVTDAFPYPPHHGSCVISYNWIRGLSLRHEVSVLSLEPAPDEAALSGLSILGVKTLGSVFTQPPRSLSIRGAFSALPMAFTRFDAALISKRVHTDVGSTCADVVVLVGPILSALFVRERAWPCPVLFVPYDSVSFNLRSRLHFMLHPKHWKTALAVGENPVRLMYYVIECWKWARLERQVYPRADGCVAVTMLDASHISARWPTELKNRIHIIPNGVDIEYFQPMRTAVNECCLVFSGTIGSVESASSLLWFLDHIFPGIKRVFPEVRLDIVGNDPPPIIREKASKTPGVRVTGFVPDIRPFLASSAIHISPLLLGSGVKNRVLEALAMGKAVVATKASCRGLEVVPGRDLVIADDAEGIQRAITELLGNPARRLALGASARQYVETTHSWGRVTERVGRLIEDLLRPSRLQTVSRSSHI